MQEGAEENGSGEEGNDFVDKDDEKKEGKGGPNNMKPRTAPKKRLGDLDRQSVENIDELLRVLKGSLGGGAANFVAHSGGMPKQVRVLCVCVRRERKRRREEKISLSLSLFLFFFFFNFGLPFFFIFFFCLSFLLKVLSCCLFFISFFLSFFSFHNIYFVVATNARSLRFW